MPRRYCAGTLLLVAARPDGSEVTATVTLIDDDALIIKLFSDVLVDAGLAVKSCTAEQFLAHYNPDEPGCLVCDVKMPGLTGLELQHRLNLMGSVIPMILISGYADIDMAVAAMQQGAFDFLQKPVLARHLVGSVRRALEVDRACREQFVAVDTLQQRFASLSDLQCDLIDLMADGSDNRAIAGELGLTEGAVAEQRQEIMRKMGAKSFAQLMHMVLELERVAAQLRSAQRSPKH